MVREIPVTRGYTAIVDDEDYEAVSAHSWCAYQNGASTRPQTRVGRATFYMHQLILPGHPEVDHKDGDGLNNCRSNLRPCTHAQNMANQRKRRNNRSGFIGVHRQAASSRWSAQVKHEGKTIHLGTFDSPEEAARMRDRAALKSYGQFAHLNFPDES